jgi:hypothetical protein
VDKTVDGAFLSTDEKSIPPEPTVREGVVHRFSTSLMVCFFLYHGEVFSKKCSPFLQESLTLNAGF